MQVKIFFVIFGIFGILIIMWFLVHHKNDVITRNVHRGEHNKVLVLNFIYFHATRSLHL